jgi:hypothetical protein
MSVKNVIFCGFLLAGCSASGSIKPIPTSPSPNSPVAGDDSAPAQQPQGTITSSGGYLYGFETNPWFLQNTEEVKYCIDMDEENFGVSKEKARSAIKFAIDSWKSQLEKVEYSLYGEDELKPWRRLRLGTQTFTEVSCADQSVSLNFQLGKLSPVQHAQVGDPRRYVAKVFETSYDEVNMRGAGFIYLAPESGPLRPDEPNADEHFWGDVNGFVLKYVLLHELGHVFGFSHSDNVIMAENGPQMFINKDVLKSLASDESSGELVLQKFLSHLFGYSEDASGVIYGSASPDVNKELFGENSNRDHAIFCEHKSNAYVTCSMYEVTSSEQGERIRGKKVGHIDGDAFSYGGKSIAKVKIPRAQNVLTISDDLHSGSGHTPLMLGTARANRFSMSGLYISEDGKVKIPMRVSSMDEFPMSLMVEVVYKDSFQVIAE